ncbi:lysylphosphatidylglycerol synthase transmembrane domain-containing protein [Amnibacterium sp.]|uniref:lysylphosphatidylglycerol synthase transmembrane domain-containing protein n=1 Tax=Amnibacterium sp. TaxID=1872496 RepID=UPI00263216ED|nr:lysylphosphatidylglycerol synthase transmembrane domain-containing protein [Amnibacterium sp.]
MSIRVPSLRWPARLAVAAVLGVLLLRFGAGPFVAGLQRLTGFAVLVALGLTAVATVASAWRWSLVSRAMGSPLPLRTAISSYYRSQLLNSVLPGGVTGDVERGLRSTGVPGRRLHGLRVVAWDRGSAQIVQLAVLAAVLLGSPGPLRLVGAVVAVVLGAVIAGSLVVGRSAPRRSGGRAARAVASFRQDLQRLAGRPGTVLAVVGASVIVVLLHASVFVLAAVVTGGSFDPVRLLPLALAVQAAMAIPVGLGGLGPREGMAAVVFAGAGLGAAQGVTAAIAYGALALIAVLPGVIPLALTHRHRRAREGATG